MHMRVHACMTCDGVSQDAFLDDLSAPSGVATKVGAAEVESGKEEERRPCVEQGSRDLAASEV